MARDPSLEVAPPPSSLVSGLAGLTREPSSGEIKSRLAEIFGELARRKALTPTEIAYGMRIIARTGKRRNYFEAAQTSADALGCSEKTIRRARKKLVGFGLFVSISNFNPSPGHPLIFRVELDIDWTKIPVLRRARRILKTPDKVMTGVSHDSRIETTDKVMTGVSVETADNPEHKSGHSDTQLRTFGLETPDSQDVHLTPEPIKPIEPHAAAPTDVQGAAPDTSGEESASARGKPLSPFRAEQERAAAAVDANLGPNLPPSPHRRAK